MITDVKPPRTEFAPYLHLKSDYRLYLEIGLLASLVLTTAVLYYPVDESGPSNHDIPPITVEVLDVPQTLQPLSTKGVPIKPVIPIASAKPQEILIEDTDVIFGSEEGLLTIPAPPAPPGKKRTEYFPPKLMVSKFPEYPKELQNKGVQGVIVLDVQVDTEGNVINHKVKQNTTGSSILEKLAIETVYKCRYNPASDGSKPLVAWTDHRFEFREKAN